MESSALVPGQISPTDVARFLRPDHCERYLRLRLHQRSGHYNFMRGNLLVVEWAWVLAAGSVENDLL